MLRRRLIWSSTLLGLTRPLGWPRTQPEVGPCAATVRRKADMNHRLTNPQKYVILEPVPYWWGMPSDRKLGFQKSATIRDVARLAGVGVGTASRVINNSPQVSSGTRASVLAAMSFMQTFC